MRPLSRRARFLLIVLAGAAAMLAGALPVLVSSGHPPTPGVTVQAGSVGTTGPEPALDPGDGAMPDTTAAPASTTTDPAAYPSIPATPTTATTAAPPTGGLPQACPAQNLVMSAGTDRTTYRPGDQITVTATITNNSARPCWVSNHGSASNAASCDPQVLLQLYDDADNYNALLGPYHAPCGPDPTVLNPGDTATGQVVIPFTPPQDCGPDPTAAACQLRAGTWTAVVNWQTGSSGAGGAEMSAEPVFYCPPDACSPSASAKTGPSTTVTTVGPSTSTTSSGSPSSTSTTAPTTHKSSTTTTAAAKTTSTTSRRANRR